MEEERRIEVDYNGYHLVSICKIRPKDNYKFIYWMMYKDNKFIMSDHSTIDGILPFQNINHSMNDAKKNVDSLNRMENDLFIYNKHRLENPELHERELNGWVEHQKRLFKNYMK